MLVAELGSLAASAARLAAADAAACAAEAADNGALATATGAEVAVTVADAAVTCANAVASAIAAGAAEAVADGLGDAEMIVSDPGPVSGTGKGRVAEVLLGSLEPKEPPLSHIAKPMRPTHTAPANNQRFDLDAVAAPAGFSFSDRKSVV